MKKRIKLILLSVTTFIIVSLLVVCINYYITKEYILKDEKAIQGMVLPDIGKELEKVKSYEFNFYPEFDYERKWTQEDEYLLAKIAMAEAENCDTHTKSLIILCVLNRVNSKEFPNTIKEVIFQKGQFTPISDGRWNRVEPNKDCYEALKIVKESKYDYSRNATYFESLKNKDNWHSKNLIFLYGSDEFRFYREK